MTPIWRDFLYRYRPAGTPGAATQAGVPVDRTAEATAELAPVFALLADVEHEATAVRARGAEAARRRVEQARAQAAAIVAAAGDRADVVRAQAAEEAFRDAERAAAELTADGRARAARIRELAAARLPVLADRALALIADAMTGRSRDGAR